MKINLSNNRINQIKERISFWCDTFDYACILNSNNLSSASNFDTYELIIGVAGSDTKTFYDFQSQENHDTWKLGYITYEYNHSVHGLENIKPALTGFNGCFFFEPQILLKIKKHSSEIEISGAGTEVIDEILNSKIPLKKHENKLLHPSVSRDEYLFNIEKIKEQIIEGTFYEINYCMEFSGEGFSIDPALVFQRLNLISPTPFATYFKQDKKYLLCASPERFIKKEANHIIAQPIKGTIRRSTDSDEDEALKQKLQQSEKEQAENIMIVDLMRNDLARCSETGSVKVSELFGVYSFATVHQLISTVSATLLKNISLQEIIRKTFPMGSMTGAPKREVMHYIDTLEKSPRGIFSGSVGYISPDNDFDFNVVIRSIVYSEENKRLSCHVGSAITYDADAATEYDECMLKSKTMFRALDTENIVL